MKNLLFLSIIFLTISCGKHSSYNSNQDEVLAAQKAISMAQEAFFAVEQGNLKKLEEFLLKNVDINALNKYGKTLLIVAVEWKRYGIVKSLLSKGADTLITDEQGMDA
ncbi:MAG: ankyrin repeat domain-containing protein, partial [Bacteriovoracaceae bacterium]